MKLIVDTPVDFVVQLLNQWLTLRNICDLEIAMCSAENRLGLGSTYEALVLECNYDVRNVQNMQAQLDWFLVRRIRVCSLRVEYLLPKNSLPKLTALIKHSSTLLLVINLSDNAIALSTVVAAVSRFCTGLKVLEVTNMALGAQFFTMLGKLHNLQNLDIFECEEINNNHLSGVLCPSIERLSLTGNFTARLQEEMLKMCPNLKSYHLSCDDVELRSVPSTLEALDIYGCNSVRIMRFNCASLRKVKITSSSIDDDGIAGLFTSCLHLQELELPNKHDFTDATARKIGDTYGQTLTTLDLFNWSGVHSSAVKYMLEKCTRLTSLSIGGRGREFDPTCVVAALDSCPTLRTLTLKCSTIPDEVLTRIAAASLESLDIYSHRELTETGMMALVNGCATLKKIKISDKWIGPLVKMMWKQLRPNLEFQ